MRWFPPAVAASFCWFASLSLAADPQPQFVGSRYAANSTAVLGAPVSTAQPAAPLNAWRGTAPPTTAGVVAAAIASDTTSPPTRTLPNDCLKALRAAVQVRSPADAYRGVDVSLSAEKLVDRAGPQFNSASPRRDEAVRPAAWVESVPTSRPASATVAPTASPRLLSDVTTAHQEATRLTRNPYRGGESAPAGGGNPLR